MRTLQLSGHGGFGGATRIMVEWSRHLVERGCEVDVLSTNPAVVETLGAATGIGHVDHIMIPREIRPVADLRAVAQLIELCRRRRYDVVHTYTAAPSFVGRLAARLAGTPVIVNHQGGWAVNPTSSPIERLVFTPLEYTANALGTRTICVTPAETAMARRLHLSPSSRLVTVVNGIDPAPILESTTGAAGEARRRELRQRLGCGDGVFLVGSTNRLVDGKDTATVLKALAVAVDGGRGPDVRLALAGNGDRDEIDRLRTMTANLGLEDRVVFLGFVEDVGSFLGAIDAWVSATLTEGLSIALLEAMVAGRPVITTSIPQNADVVTHGVHGVLVDVASTDQLAAAFVDLAGDPARAHELGRRARDHALSVYSRDRMFDETWELYVDLLGGKGRPVPQEVVHGAG